jgi:glycosyltransferase involved in cell wall biosynthesis
MRDGGELESVFVGRVGPPRSREHGHPGTRFGLAGADPDDYLFHVESEQLDPLMWRGRDKRLYLEDWPALLAAVAPDVVHFHHCLWLGYDMLAATRRALPHAAILYTAHDFIPICRHGGQMVRTDSFELCPSASPRRCHQCFPKVPPDTFFLRQRFIQHALDHADLLLAPSRFARERYIAWGVAPERILYEENGSAPSMALPDPPDAGRRRTVGYFGQLSPAKGIEVLLEAMQRLAGTDGGAQLILHGANLDLQPPDYRERVRSQLAATTGSVHFAGSYQQAELAQLMSAVDWVVVPSIWWENAPLVIQEAKAHGRPVICSDIGGMAEQVQAGVNGLHFRVRDPGSLAETITQAVTDPAVWQRLRAGIEPPHAMDAHITRLARLYADLLGQRESRQPA